MSPKTKSPKKPGTKVQIKTKSEQFEGILLPSPQPDIIMLKLESGYNIGLPENSVKSIKKLSPGRKLESFPSLKAKQKPNLPGISFIITGGTISSRIDYETGGVKPLSKPEQLLFLSPQLLDLVKINSIEKPFMVLSENMAPKHWQKIAGTAAKLLNEKENQGIIVTHGTDILHYTAAALSFMLRELNKPLILTYSQRSTDRGSTDTVLNLQCSAHAALSNIAEVMIVGHGTASDNSCLAIRGTKVRKMSSSRRDTFRPINELPLARISSQGEITILNKTHKNKDPNRQVNEDTAFEQKTALVKYYPGASPELLDILIDKSYKGIVIEGTGFGNIAIQGEKSWLASVERAIKSNIPVCMTSQAFYGKTNPYVYETGRKLEKAGMIYCEDMLPETAYVKLGWVLGHTQAKKEVKHLMLTNIAGELNKKISEKAFLY